jgi:hypothetical protein
MSVCKGSRKRVDWSNLQKARGTLRYTPQRRLREMIYRMTLAISVSPSASMLPEGRHNWASMSICFCKNVTFFWRW